MPLELSQIIKEYNITLPWLIVTHAYVLKIMFLLDVQRIYPLKIYLIYFSKN